MNEYTATTNYGKFQYPSHFKYPEGSENYFLQHHFVWKDIIKQIETDEPRCAIEIGALHGGCSVWLMENYLNREKDRLFCIDINESEYLKNNLQPYENADLKLGLSSDVLVDMIQEYKQPIANLIYIDGSHIAKHVMEDAILSWKLLKVGGIMVFDDYGWGSAESVEHQPKTGIDAFLHGYQKHYQPIGQGWQVFIKKIHHEMNAGVLSSNYADNNKFFNKQSY